MKYFDTTFKFAKASSVTDRLKSKRSEIRGKAIKHSLRYLCMYTHTHTHNCHNSHESDHLKAILEM